MVPQVDSQVYIQAYKHDGSLHRSWCMADVLEADEEHFVVVTNKSWVVEDNGRRWYTREPAVAYFYTHRWYNVIAMIRQESVYFYVNLSSPALYDGEAIKYIDYDIDFKIYDDLMMTMDLDEYLQHGRQMHYPQEIDKIIKKEMKRIEQEVSDSIPPFDRQYVEAHFEQYLKQLAI